MSPWILLYGSCFNDMTLKALAALSREGFNVLLIGVKMDPRVGKTDFLKRATTLEGLKIFALQKGYKAQDCLRLGIQKFLTLAPELNPGLIVGDVDDGVDVPRLVSLADTLRNNPARVVVELPLWSGQKGNRQHLCALPRARAVALTKHTFVRGKFPQQVFKEAIRRGWLVSRCYVGETKSSTSAIYRRFTVWRNLLLNLSRSGFAGLSTEKQYLNR